MTWRRLEDGLPVRRRSLAAVDRFLGVDSGMTMLALDDDRVLLRLVRTAGVDVETTPPGDCSAAIDALAARFDGIQERAGAAWPAIDERHRLALAELAGHVPTVRPTDLQLVQGMVDRLTRRKPTPAINDLVQSALRAMPDLIARQPRDAERELADEPCAGGRRTSAAAGA